jgi:hypothetical protein
MSRTRGYPVNGSRIIMPANISGDPKPETPRQKRMSATTTQMTNVVKLRFFIFPPYLWFSSYKPNSNFLLKDKNKFISDN